MKATDLLVKAAEVISGPRREDYGDPEESFGRIARLWSAYLNVELQPSDVALLMALLKISRAATSLDEDSLVDLAGYAALAPQVDGATREVKSPGMTSV